VSAQYLRPARERWGHVSPSPPSLASRAGRGRRTERGQQCIARAARMRLTCTRRVHPRARPPLAQENRTRTFHRATTPVCPRRCSPATPPLPSPPLPRCIMDRIPMVPTGNIATLEASVARTTVRVHRVYMEIFPRKKHGSVSRSPLPPARPPPRLPPSLPPRRRNPAPPVSRAPHTNDRRGVSVILLFRRR